MRGTRRCDSEGVSAPRAMAGRRAARAEPGGSLACPMRQELGGRAEPERLAGAGKAGRHVAVVAGHECGRVDDLGDAEGEDAVALVDNEVEGDEAADDERGRLDEDADGDAKVVLGQHVDGLEGALQDGCGRVEQHRRVEARDLVRLLHAAASTMCPPRGP